MKYALKQFPDKVFTDKMDQARFIKSNLEAIKAIKREQYKTDAEYIFKAGLLTGGFKPMIEDITSDIIEVKAIINTTNVIDSHMDLHLQGIWNKTVKDNPYSYHLKQHERMFESVISSKAKNVNERMKFSDIGVNSDMEMDANINQFLINKADHPLMFKKYADGEVTQHSVGMMYVNYDIAWYDEDSEKEMNFFNEMKALAINPEVAEEAGYLWVHREAKKREGSAVVFGSNPFTPTLYVKNYEPQSSTYKQKSEAADKHLITNSFINPNLY